MPPPTRLDLSIDRPDNASRSRRAKEMRVSIEARNSFERLIQRDPDHLDHYYDYAQMLAAMGNHSEALVQLNTALAYCPFEPEWDIEAAASY